MNKKHPTAIRRKRRKQELGAKGFITLLFVDDDPAEARLHCVTTFEDYDERRRKGGRGR